MGKVKTYSAVVLLGGHEYDKVPRTDLTDQEVRVLRAIHGYDSVQNIEVAGEREQPSEREGLFVLARTYGIKRVEKAFETTLHDYPEWLERVTTYELEREERRLDAAYAQPAPVVTPAPAVAAVPPVVASGPDAVSAAAGLIE